MLCPWELLKLKGFLHSRNLGYSKLYDSTNEIYLYVNENGRLNSTAESLDDDRMYWTRSLDGTIENKATGKLIYSNDNGKMKLILRYLFQVWFYHFMMGNSSLCGLIPNAWLHKIGGGFLQKQTMKISSSIVRQFTRRPL